MSARSFSFFKECYVSRDITRADAPFLASVGTIAVECARRDIVLGVGYEYVACFGMDGNAIWYGDIALGPVGNKSVRHDLFCACVDDALADGI